MIRMNRGLTLSMLALGVVSAANAQIAFDNGPLQTAAGLSVLQTAAPLSMTVFGYGMNGAVGTDVIVADDLVVPAHATLRVDSVTFFGYQTGSTTTSTFTSYLLRVWDTVPAPAGTPIAGDRTTNRLTSSAFSGLFRVTDTATSLTNRPIMANRVANTGNWMPNLTNGTFWFEWSALGSLASGPWAPPVTILGQGGKPGGNARQVVGATGTWAPIVDGPAPGLGQDLPFVVRGTWRLVPTAVSVESGFGTNLAGNLASLANSDNNRYLVINDENEAEGRILVKTNVPYSNGNAAALTFTVETISVRDDLLEFFAVKNDSNTYDDLNFRVSSLSDFVTTVNVTSNAGNYVAANGDIDMRVQTIPSADLDAGDGWSSGIDQLVVDVTPTN